MKTSRFGILCPALAFMTGLMAGCFANYARIKMTSGDHDATIAEIKENWQEYDRKTFSLHLNRTIDELEEKYSAQSPSTVKTRYKLMMFFPYIFKRQ